jgi:hypothetical protein
MSVKRNLKVTLVIVVILIIMGLLTMGSGMLAKLFMKANSCHQTKLLLFVSGVILCFLIAGLGFIIGKMEEGKEEKDLYSTKLAQWILKEQYRYAPPMSGSG